MRRAGFLLLMATVLTFSPNLLHAQVVRGSWAKMDAQPAGVRLIIRLYKGPRITCTLREITDTNLLVALDSSAEMRIAKGDVAEVTTQARHGDSLNNGAGYGLGLGIGFGILNGVLQGGAAAAGTIVGFTGWGVLIDWLHKGREVLYKAR